MFRDSIDIDYDSDLLFQISDWYQKDVEDDDDNRSYIIKIFGVSEEGYSICVNILDFEPYFYITHKKKTSLNIFEINQLSTQLTNMLPASLKEDFDIVSESKKSLWGFTNNTYKQYIKLSFRNLTCMYILRKFLRNQKKYEFHESNIEPFIRFIHTKEISAGGWIRISKWIDNQNDNNDTKCQINVQTSYHNVFPVESTKITPLVILSFDIECTSSHGDFPVPIKTYKKTANELVDFYKKIKHLEWYSSVKPQLYEALTSIFTNESNYLSHVITKESVDTDLITDFSNKYMDEIHDILEGKTNPEKFVLEYDVEPTVSNQIEFLLNDHLPPLEGDNIIQIGSTIHKYGDTNCVYKNIITLDSCDDIAGVDVIQCKTEKEMIKKWCQLIKRIDPDIITGYNILGFDFEYIYKRASELHCKTSVLKCSRLKNHKSKYIEKVLASSALGENILKYFEMEGRVIIDLMKVVQRDHKLDSYKLDNVASHFISGKVVKFDKEKIFLDSLAGIQSGDFIKINDMKCKILEIFDDSIIIDQTIENPKTWGLAKDDVSPKEIFQCQKGTSADRAKIAKYCIQDCALCNLLIIKLEVIANNLGMANVCHVPLSYIFMRGQGIKIFSLVAKQCREDDYIIPVVKYEENDSIEEQDGYEGAIVLDPSPGIYVDNPINVMDFASLYPSSMISENVSHDSIVLDSKYDNIEGISYVDITYDIFNGIGDKKKKVGEKVCRYAQNDNKSVLPRILMKLLSQRKFTRKKSTFQSVITKDKTFSGILSDFDTYITITNQEDTWCIEKNDIISVTDTFDEFSKAMLDGLQLAYKITANSLYGQVGAKTSPIYLKQLAASTTATGRNLIMKAKDFMIDNYQADIIYGDTDSIFIDFKVKTNFNISDDKEALQKSIDIAMDASNAFNKTLKKPHDLEYEKTFFPFIILSKKKYVGNLYEHDIHKFKQKSMGIVLKRRDNANIVKIIYGGIIDILLNNQNIQQAISFLSDCLNKLIKGDFPLEDLVITKTLRNTYKDPSKIAHKVLADRMKTRDPGSAPQTNDRIPFVYIEHDIKNKSLLQGDKIEHPSFIIQNDINIDYVFYITNQIMKPVCQLLSLALFDIPKCTLNEQFFIQKEKRLLQEYEHNIRKTKDKISDIKQLEVKKILFDNVLHTLNNKRLGNRAITDFFKVI
jgi:DNA polymerase elongation subunit (family B)